MAAEPAPSAMLLPLDEGGRPVVYDGHGRAARRGDAEASLLTEIVCTLGPASWHAPGALFEAGMTVARLNCSHARSDGSDLAAMAVRLRELAEADGRPLLVLGDLQGPKTRVGLIVGGAIELRRGAAMLVDLQQHALDRSAESDQRIVLQPTHPCRALLAAAQPGAMLLLDDGKLQLKVTAVGRAASGSSTGIRVVVERGGTLTPGKGVSLPGVPLDTPAITPKDLLDARTLVRAGVDLVAMSFVRTAADVTALRGLLAQYHAEAIAEGVWQTHGPPPLPKVVVKIETIDALKNATDIIDETDGLMVARGDLAVDAGFAAVPLAQKRLLQACQRAARPQPFSIVATEMLASLSSRTSTAPFPTRAEASDVVNAVLDGTDACMTSGETTEGADPVGAVRVMYSLIAEAERTLSPAELARKAVQAAALVAIFDAGAAARKSPPVATVTLAPEPAPTLRPMTPAATSTADPEPGPAAGATAEDNEIDGDVSCLVCWEELDVKQTQKATNCDHRFCAACLYSHCRVSIVDSGYAPACPMGNIRPEHGGCGTALAAVDAFRVIRRHALHASDGSGTAAATVDAVIQGIAPKLLYGTDAAADRVDPRMPQDADAKSWLALWNDDLVTRPELSDARVAALFGELLLRSDYMSRQAVACPSAGCGTWCTRPPAAADDVATGLECGGCRQSFCSACRFSPMHRGAPGEAGCSVVAEAAPLWTEWLSSERSEWLERAAKAALEDNTKDEDNAFLVALAAWDQTAAGRATAIRDAHTRIDELRANETWKAENCKHCPSCNRVINKLSGCDSMVCGRDWHGGNAQAGCGTHFEWSEAPPYRPVEVRQPGNQDLVAQKQQGGQPRGFGVVHYSEPGVAARCDICRRGVVGPRFSCLSCAPTSGRCFTACVLCDPSRVHDPSHVWSIGWVSSSASGSPRAAGSGSVPFPSGSRNFAAASEDDAGAARQGLAALPPASRAAVAKFVRGSAPGESLELPPTLTDFQRRQLHAWAASVGLASRSRGEGVGRHIVLALLRPPSLALLDMLSKLSEGGSAAVGATVDVAASASEAARVVRAQVCSAPTATDRPRCYVLLSGKRGVGKDFVGALIAAIFEDSRGLRRKGRAVTRRLADTVKRAFCAAHDVDFSKLSSTDAADRAYKESHRESLTQFFSAYTREFASGAAALSQLARGLVASVCDDGATSGAGDAAGAEGVALVVICDIRSPAEVAWFRSNCGHSKVFCVGISCPAEQLVARGTIAEAAKDSDATETAMDGYDSFDVQLVNDEDGEATRRWAAAELLPLLFAAL